MADVKISALSELTSVDDSDVLAIIDDPSGTPTSKKITKKNLVRDIVGQSTDTKPTNLDSGRWRYEERDTGRLYLWNGSKWIQDGFIKEVESTKTEGSPLIRLTGDEFATTAESSLYLLEDTSSAISGTALTNNGTITFSKDNDLPLRGFNVPTLNGSSQYFSLPTESSVEVGTGSFTASIWFKTTGNANRLFSYGDQYTTAHWWISINMSNKMHFRINDTVAASDITDTRANIYNDGKWHCAVMVVDRESALFSGYVDGKLIGTSDISGTTSSLTVTPRHAHAHQGQPAGLWA